MSKPRVLLVRPDPARDSDAVSLREAGVDVIQDPYLVVTAASDPDAPARAGHVLAAIAASADWLVITSPKAVDALASLTSDERLSAAIREGQLRGLRIAAVGRSTAARLEDRGAVGVSTPHVSTAEALASRLLAESAPSGCILPIGDQALPTLARTLEDAGWSVDAPVVYCTAQVTRSPNSAERLAAGEFAAIVLRSPTAVRAVDTFVPNIPDSTVAVCGGPTTLAEARRHGFPTIVQSADPTSPAIARAVTGALTRGEQT